MLDRYRIRAFLESLEEDDAHVPEIRAPACAVLFTVKLGSRLEHRNKYSGTSVD